MQNEINQEIKNIEDKTKLLREKIKQMQERKYVSEQNLLSSSLSKKALINLNSHKEICSICNKTMDLTINLKTNAKFYQCSGYPQCKNIKIIGNAVSFNGKMVPPPRITVPLNIIKEVGQKNYNIEKSEKMLVPLNDVEVKSAINLNRAETLAETKTKKENFESKIEEKNQEIKNVYSNSEIKNGLKFWIALCYIISFTGITTAIVMVLMNLL